ncbi:hypothetical protein JCM11491_004053 [Sporobolomyces phaffii]
MPLPSLSSLLSHLPSVSLPPLIPLPSNVQQRLVSFLLRKTLGGIVKGGLDSDRIEADIRDGTFAINRVEIDPQAIAPLLASTPTLSFASGTISHISAKVSYPLAQLSLAVSDVEIVLRVQDRVEAEEWLGRSTETIHPIPTAAGAGGDDRDADTMRESMISIAVAQDFIEHELSPSEDAELRASLHLSPPLASQSDFFLPGAFGGAPNRTEEPEKAEQEAEEVETTMLAGLIERILARLKVKVSKVTIRLVWNDAPEGEETNGEENELEVRIDEIEYLGDANSTEEGGARQTSSSVRAVKVSPPRAYLRLAPPSTDEASASDSSSTSASTSTASSIAGDELAPSVALAESIASLPPSHPSQPLSRHGDFDSDSGSDSSGDENDLLALSQSIADLRTSTASLAQLRASNRTAGPLFESQGPGGLHSIDESGGSEMFASATSFVSAKSIGALDQESRARDPEEKVTDRADELDPFSNPDSPTRATDSTPATPHRLILSLGFPSGSDPLIFYLSSRLASSVDADPTLRSRPSLHITASISSGWVLALTTEQLTILLKLAERVVPSQTQAVPLPSSAPSRSNSPPPPDVSIVVKSITLLLAHPSPTTDADALEHLWDVKDPSCAPPISIKVPHLRAKLDEISIKLENGFSRLGVRDLTLCEVLCEDKGEKQAWKALPLVVSDHGLAKEGSSEVGGDWTADGAGLGKDWRVKLSGSVGAGGGSRRRSQRTEVDDDPAKTEAIKIERAREGTVDINVSPLHLFVDLTILSRWLPALGSLGRASSGARTGASTPRFNAHRLARPLTPAISPFSQAHLLEDLSRPDVRTPTSEKPTPAIRVHCSLLRIDLRCPAPRRVRMERRDHSSVRSGIAILELEQLQVAQHDGAILGKVKEARAGIRVVGGNSKPSTFVKVSSLSPSEPDSVLPSFRLRPSATCESPTILQTSLPLVHVKIDKPTLDTLQLFADDVSQFFNTELSTSTSFGGSSSEREREKLIGSRYFGTKSFRGSARFARGARGGGLDSEEDESRAAPDDGRVKMLVELDVTDLVIDLLVPTAVSSLSQRDIKHLRLLASDLDVSLTTLEHGSDDLRARIEIGDIKVEELGPNSDEGRKVIIARTFQRDLTSTSIQPLVKLAFTTSSDPQTDLKESRVELGLDGFTYYFETGHLDLSQDLGRFVKAPEGAFEQVVPNELTRLRLRLSNLSVHLTPPTLASRLVVSLGETSIKSDLMPDLPRTTWSVETRRIELWAVESADDLKQADVGGVRRGSQSWKAKGFVSLGELEKASIVTRQGNGLVLPDTELLVSNARVRLSLCADSVSAITDFADDLLSAPGFRQKANAPSPSPSPGVKPSSTTGHSTPDLFASVDDSAFDKAASIHDLPEFLGDDVPANSDYLADTLSRRGKKPTRRSRASDAPTRARPGRVTEDIGGETVRMLSSKGLEIHDDWLAESRCDDLDFSAPASRIRVRLSDTDISIHLHEGYDWSKTRKAIEDESKAVRRRLEKIRQLLANGQTPDATAENASVLMFGSHHLGLPPGANEMAPKDLLAAIEEELETGGPDDDAVSTAASSWQTFPGGAPRTSSASKKPIAAVVGKGRRRLTRSKAFAIEVNVRGLGAKFDTYATDLSPPSALSSTSRPASKIRVDVSSFDIIDNIKTSTWRKFLTEMRPSDGGVVRASGSPMAKFELETTDPAGKGHGAQEEISMKIKIAPLRLYIDQDALDFLKAFGAFKAPPTARSHPNVPSSPAAQEPFYKRVEVLPVKIKLDYKPKRVDYYALKQGKTAELMNFFHFDGSEMVLRHLVVTGVSGTTTLSNLVQDIWTPDVKANQLADVISGIAPVRSVVNVGSGVANLVLLPIEQYRKDGRVVRGLQKGAQAFAKQTTLEAINVGAKLANGTQVILEQAEHVLGAKFSHRVHGETLSSLPDAGPSSGESLVDFDEVSDEDIKKVRSRYAEQPTDLRQGVESAYKSLGENFKEAAQTILAVPMEVYERSGNEGPVRAVVRAVPIAVLRPMIGASGAVSKALLGLRNSLDPDQQQGELEDKYKPRPDQS